MHLLNLCFSGWYISSCVAKCFSRHGRQREAVVQATLCSVVKQ